jgi:hypothetical protein
MFSAASFFKCDPSVFFLSIVTGLCFSCSAYAQSPPGPEQSIPAFCVSSDGTPLGPPTLAGWSPVDPAKNPQCPAHTRPLLIYSPPPKAGPAPVTVPESAGGSR